MKSLFCGLLFLTVAIAPAFAEGSYTLKYKAQNRWVAQEDASGLRTMLKDAQKQNIQHFFVELPSTKRDVTIERLIVLRDILEKQLGNAVTIEETDKNTMNNEIHVTFKK